MRDRAREGRRVHAIRAKRENEGRRVAARGKEGKKDGEKKKEGKRKRERSRKDRGRRDYVSFEKCDENGECRTCLSTRAPREGGDQRGEGERAKEEERGSGRVVGRLLGRV